MAGLFVAGLVATKTHLTSVRYFLAVGALVVNIGIRPTETVELISTEVFYTLMLPALWLNVAVPVTIKLWKPSYDRAQALLEPESG